MQSQCQGQVWQVAAQANRKEERFVRQLEKGRPVFIMWLKERDQGPSRTLGDQRPLVVEEDQVPAQKQQNTKRRETGAEGEQPGTGDSNGRDGQRSFKILSGFHGHPLPKRPGRTRPSVYSHQAPPGERGPQSKFNRDAAATASARFRALSRPSSDST